MAMLVGCQRLSFPSLGALALRGGHVKLPQLIELLDEYLVVSLLDLQFQLQLIVLVDHLRDVHVELGHLFVLELKLLPSLF